VLIILSRGKHRSGFPPLFHASTSRNGSSTIVGLDVSVPRTAAEKAAQLITATMESVDQAKQLENPDSVVSLENLSQDGLLKDFMSYSNEVQAGDAPRFTSYFWEVQDSKI
jgi:hypothetical protein